MMSPRWKKLLRDLQAAQGRMLMIVIAIAVSVFAIATMLTTYTIMSREMAANYLGTNPASAFIDIHHIDESLVEAVRQQPNIADAEASSWLSARVQISENQWMPALLFVVDDFEDMRLSTFFPESGAWPPDENTILLERAVLEMLPLNIGDSLSLQTINGHRQSIAISGFVHDPSLAPAWQEQTVYGYISVSTLSYLGESPNLDILKVLVDQPTTMPAIEATVGDLSLWLSAQGYELGEIRIPPPYQHPHQSQMSSVMGIFISFSIMALILSAILTASMIGGLLAQQIRQIGIMKAIGASSNQIIGMYLLLVAALGLVAFIFSAPLGIVAGRGFSIVIARLLNLSIRNDEIPAYIYLILFLMSILVPLIVAQYPIRRTSRTTVREILNDYGISRENFGKNRFDSYLSSIRGMDKTLLMALRNSFRRRSRLVLTLGLLAAAGGVFMTAINVKTSWENYVETAAAERHYDLEIRFTNPESEAQIMSSLSSIEGVQALESWNRASAAVYRPDALEIVRTYPDGGHGSFTLRSSLPESTFIATPMLQGTWLQAGGDSRGIVLNQNAAAFFNNLQIGDEIRLLVDGAPSDFRLIGIVRQLLTPATAYVLPETFSAATGQAINMSNALRVQMTSHDENSMTEITSRIEASLASQNIPIDKAVSEALLDDAISGHVMVFIVALLLISLVMAVVGVLGLMSSMGTSVVERTREFGIMRTIGAESKTIMRNLISEALFIGLMSWLIALPLSLPISLALGNYLGMMAFRSALPFIISPIGLAIWLILIVIGSIAASAYPAQQASRLSIRETLAYL